MTPDAAQGEGRPRDRRLVGLSGLLPLVAAACIARLALVAVDLPSVEGVAQEAGQDVARPEPGFGPIEPDLDGKGLAAAVAPAAGPAPQPATAPVALPAAAPTGVPAATGGAPDGVLSPKALLAVAAELKGRRELVERRERELETREAALDLVEERLAAQIDRLEGLKRDLEGVLGQISADEQARLDQLAKVYEAMRAKKAASILDAMALDLLLPVVRRMRDTKVAAVIAEMDPAKARLLTAELAKAKTLPSLPPPAPAEPLPLAR